MRKVIQEFESDTIIEFEFYDLDEPNELQITLDDHTSEEKVINLGAKQAKKLYKYFKSHYENTEK